MVDVVGTIQGAIDIVSRLHKLSKKIQDAEFTMLLAELSDDLASARLEAARLKGELAESITANQLLNEQLKKTTEEKPVLSGSGYKFSDDDGPFCTGCYDTRKDRIRLTPTSREFRSSGKWKCPACATRYQ